jgi:hypothetical protein
VRAALKPLPARLALGVVVVLIVAWISGRFETGSGTQEVREAGSPVPARPSLAEARWQGRWQFDYTLTKLEGVGEQSSDFKIGSKIRRVWEVNPKCDRGPCGADISATDPDDPSSDPITTAVTYEKGVYRTSQTFPPVHSEVCRGSAGEQLQAQFEATNLVEVTPTRFDVKDGQALVSELQATKTTTFKPAGPAEGAGGSCNLKGAVWVATVRPVG